MTKTLENLKRVMNDIASRSEDVHFDYLLDAETKRQVGVIHRAKADAVYEVGVKLLSERVGELNLLMKHRDNLILY